MPELASDPALRDLVCLINHEENGLVSIGCGSLPVSEDGKHRWSGYIEFAINTVEGIADAQNSFFLFFHFDKMLRDINFNAAVRYNWELAGANFFLVNAAGFTCTVWINVPFVPTLEEAKASWGKRFLPLRTF